MKVILFVLLCALEGCTAQIEDEHKMRQDLEDGYRMMRVINMESLTKRPRVMLMMMKCLVNEGPCDFMGSMIKRTLAFGVENECPTCTGEDRSQMIRLLKAMKHETGPYYYKKMIEVLFDGVEPPEFEAV